MPEVKFDVSGSDPDKAKGFIPPPPGVYPVIVKECKPGFKMGEDDKPDKTAPRLEIVADISKGKHKGARLYDYLSFSEAAQWRMDQFLQVFGIATAKKRKGKFKTEDIVGMPALIKVKGETYKGEYSAKIGAWLEGSDEDILNDDEAEEEEVDEVEEEESDEEEEVEEEEESEEEGYTEEDLMAMELAMLNEILTTYGETKPKSFKNKAAKTARILEIQAEALDASGEEEEESEEEEEEEGDEYDELDRAALAKLVKGRSLPVLKKDDEDALRQKLRDDDASDPFSG